MFSDAYASRPSSCASPPRAVGVAHCIVGEARGLAHGPAKSIRTNLIDALGRTAAVFAVLSVRTGCTASDTGGARTTLQRRQGAPVRADKGACGTATSLAQLGDALARLNATDTRLVFSDTQMVAPVHGCAYGPRRASSGYWQWINVERCFELVRSYEASHCVRFSHITRTRPDMFVASPLQSIETFSTEEVTIGFRTRFASGSSADRGRPGSARAEPLQNWIDDRFAIVPRQHADVYFRTVRGYFKCRPCQEYRDSCGLFQVGCTKRVQEPGAMALHKPTSEQMRAIRQGHVGSECMIGTWLHENSVPLRVVPALAPTLQLEQHATSPGTANLCTAVLSPPKTSRKSPWHDNDGNEAGTSGADDITLAPPAVGESLGGGGEGAGKACCRAGVAPYGCVKNAEHCHVCRYKCTFVCTMVELYTTLPVR